MRKTIEITGIIADKFDMTNFKVLLGAAGVSQITIKTLPQFDDWLANLPKKSIKGLEAECLDWIRAWGNGGGDASSEDCITEAIEQLKCNIPFKIARTVYNSVVDYSKSEFEAAGLTIEMINSCIKELMVELREKTSEYEEGNS